MFPSVLMAESIKLTSEDFDLLYEVVVYEQASLSYLLDFQCLPFGEGVPPNFKGSHLLPARVNRLERLAQKLEQIANA